ncbi:unnamed protein product, partial [Staurois parvus]
RLLPFSLAVLHRCSGSSPSALRSLACVAAPPLQSCAGVAAPPLQSCAGVGAPPLSGRC